MIVIDVDEALLLWVEDESSWQDAGEMPRLMNAGRPCSLKLLPFTTALSSPVNVATLPCYFCSEKEKRASLCTVLSWC